MVIMNTHTRKEEMLSMRNSGMTLNEIAGKYGISRERVRQIIGNTGSDFMKKFTESALEKVDLSQRVTNDISDLIGIKKIWLDKMRSLHHKIAGGAAKQGEEVEELVSKKLTSLGIKNKLMPYGNQFDIITDDGIMIDVKSTSVKTFTSNKQKSDLYYFKTKKDKRGDYCDYFIFYIILTNDFFVIPNFEVPYSNGVYITWPCLHKKQTSKWPKYHNRFDLLKGK